MYFDSYKSSIGCQRNKKCKNYILLESIKNDEKDKEQTQKKYKNAIKLKRQNSLCTSKTKEC